ncbi:hypothetical protein M5K25_006772 [Dendrobium thyrsiflorum]|uniref:Reverse transcriptase zinc-binding domain-containing protein n=1 Tax=Dendrobium thyrsiflorum TaxID=117978 RepID=A0ABD0VC23_DENTH
MILFGNSVSRRRKCKINAVLRFGSVKEIIYLVVKMALIRMKAIEYQNILKKAMDRLNTWGSLSLPLAGKILLIKTAFSSDPTFLMTHSLISKGVIDDLDRYCRNFLWHEDQERQGIHYISWKILCIPSHQGGFGIQGLLRARIAWNFIQTQDSILSKILTSKYGNYTWKEDTKRNSSPAWRIIKDGARFLLPTIKWKELINIILEIPIESDAIEDKPILISTFSRKSITAIAYDTALNNQQDFVINTKWLKKLKISPKENLFWWRLINNAIPTNAWLHYRRLIECSSCPRACEEIEDGNHISVHCRKLLEITEVLNKWGIHFPNFHNLSHCWNKLERITKTNPGVVRIYISVVYHNWKARNLFKHGKSVPTPSMIASQILSQSIQPYLYPICQNWDTNQHHMLSYNWYPPPTYWIKLNVDASLLHFKLAEIHGVVCDHRGRFLLAYGKKLVHWDVSLLELIAVFYFKNYIQEWMIDKKGIVIDWDNINSINLMKISVLKNKGIKKGIQCLDFSFLESFKNVIF